MEYFEITDLHLADCLFLRHCKERFGINRGVYNTIDAWFYEKGMTEIIERRKNILSFLQTVLHRTVLKNGDRKFGHGGLAEELNIFWENSQQLLKNRELQEVMKKIKGRSG